jgi:predicted MFS family arabinose efflux permease
MWGSSGSPAASPIDRPHHNVTFVVLAVAGVSYALLQSLVAPALPDIQHALHTSADSVSWVLTGYLLSASVATPLIGRLGDMYGKERLLVMVLALLSVGTLVTALASSLGVMLLRRTDRRQPVVPLPLLAAAAPGRRGDGPDPRRGA